jgi:hypothetical protein
MNPHITCRKLDGNDPAVMGDDGGNNSYLRRVDTLMRRIALRADFTGRAAAENGCYIPIKINLMQSVMARDGNAQSRHIASFEYGSWHGLCCGRAVGGLSQRGGRRFRSRAMIMGTLSSLEWREPPAGSIALKVPVGAIPEAGGHYEHAR